jgi:hypothetical protein
MLLPETSNVIARLNTPEPGAVKLSVGSGPVISQFPANGLAGGVTGLELPPPQPIRTNPNTTKEDKALTFISIRTLARAIFRSHQKEKADEISHRPFLLSDNY